MPLGHSIPMPYHNLKMKLPWMVEFFQSGRIFFDHMNTPSPIHTLEVNMLAPSVNAYWLQTKWGGRRITPKGKLFQVMCIKRNHGHHVVTDKPLRVDVDLYSTKWITAKGKPSKSAGDIDNFMKGSLDGLSRAIRVDDSQIFELAVRKLQGADKTVFKVFEL